MAKAKYKVTNVVAAGNLHMELDLYQLPLKFKNIEYEPEQFPGAILKFNVPKATVLVFKNGKIVIVGCKDKQVVEEAVLKAYQLLSKVAIRVDKKITAKNVKEAYEITNIVAAADLSMEMDLFRVAMEVEGDIEYEPEQFPGAILKLREPKVSVLIFKNGKLILAGARTKKEIEKALVEVEEILKKFRN